MLSLAIPAVAVAAVSNPDIHKGGTDGCSGGTSLRLSISATPSLSLFCHSIPALKPGALHFRASHPDHSTASSPPFLSISISPALFGHHNTRGRDLLSSVHSFTYCPLPSSSPGTSPTCSDSSAQHITARHVALPLMKPTFPPSPSPSILFILKPLSILVSQAIF